MRISELRAILCELQYEQGDIDFYAFVTRESGYLLDCHNATHPKPLIKTGKDYTIVCENVHETKDRVTGLDGFPQQG